MISKIYFVVLLLHCCCIRSATARTTTSRALFKKSASIERKIWNTWTKHHHRWGDDYSTSFNTPVQFVAANPSKETTARPRYKLVMPRTAMEEWEFYSTQSFSEDDERLAKDIQRKTDTKPRKYSSSSHESEQKQLPPKWFQRFMEDYNFKGFGMSFYKSMLFLKSAGVSFRMPILGNWDRWDSNPALPCVNGMISIYLFPFSISVALTSSVRMEAIKYLVRKTLTKTKYSIQYVLYQFIRSFYILFSTVLYPVHGKWFEPALPIMSSEEPSTPIHYKANIQERLGMSMRYGWSMTRGWHTRTSYWHYYMPTIAFMQQVLREKLYMSKKTSRDADKYSTNEADTWLSKHFAGLGTDTGATSEADPFATCVLSLSGFYIQHLTKKNKKTATTSPFSKAEQHRKPQTSLWSSNHYYISSLSLMNILAEAEQDNTKHRNDVQKRRHPYIPRGGDLIYLTDTKH